MRGDEEIGDNVVSFSSINSICELFYAIGRKSINNKAKFFAIKKDVCLLYKSIAELYSVSPIIIESVEKIDMDTVISSSEIQSFYFKDLPMAINFVSHIGYFYGFDGTDCFLPLKTLVILLWHDVKLEEMPYIKKTDIICKRQAVVIGDRIIDIDYGFDIIAKYAEDEEFLSCPGERKHKTKESSYLFRTSHRESMDYQHISGIIRRFNSAIPEHIDKKINVSCVKKSSIFSQTKKAIQEDPYSQPQDVISDLLGGIDPSMAFGYASLYRKWEEYFYGGR